MTIVEKECNGTNRQFNETTLDLIINIINSNVESRQEKEEWINRYFSSVIHKHQWYLEIEKKKALNKINQSQFCNIGN